MFIHVFGAYFGLAFSLVIYRKDVKDAEDDAGSVYHSDIFSMIGKVWRHSQLTLGWTSCMHLTHKCANPPSEVFPCSCLVFLFGMCAADVLRLCIN